MPAEREAHRSAVCCWCRSPLVWGEGHWWCSTPACRTRQRESALQVQVNGVWRWWFVPLPTQAQFDQTRAPRKLWGGRAGPGKSYGARRLAIRRCFFVKGINVLLVRKTYKELDRTHIKALRRESQELGFQWVEGRYEAVFPNGSTIECGHLEDDAAVQKYLSTEYDLIIVDEAVQISPDPLMELMSRARSSNPAVIAHGGAEVWLVTNPGGPAHALLRDVFMTRTVDPETYPALAASFNPDQWVYIPATIDDNPYLDPSYETLALAGLRRARYQQLRFGDWDAADGQFFEMLSARTHVRDVTVPRPIDGVVEAIDWGFTSPGTVAWYVPLADGHWWVLDEWKFQRQTAEEVARGLRERRKALGIRSVAYTVADPSMFNKTGAGSYGESMAETFARNGVPLRPGDNQRTMGWPRLAAWYRPAADGVPWLTYSPACAYSLRSIPSLLSDPHDPEDVDTRLDDHAADRDRYFVMSRPPLSAGPTVQTAPVVPNSWGWWRRFHVKQAAAPRW